MTKFRLGIIAMLAVIGVVTFLMIQQQSKLREENRLLRQQIEQLALLQAENDQLSNALAQAKNAQTLPSARLNELLRLRGEIGSLRRQTNDLGSENQRLRSSLFTSKPGTQTAPTRESLPKESWGLVGYADPESAFQSAVWAMRQGDAKTFRASLAPGGGEFTEWQDKSDDDLSTRIKGEAEKVTAFKIMDKDAISDETAILTVMAEGINEVGRFKLQRIGTDWKLAGPVQEGAAPNTK
jgi:type II secretory pathway pseudopilin PulG